MAMLPSAEALERALDEKCARPWQRLFELREDVLKALETARASKVISGSLEAKLVLRAQGKIFERLQEYAAFLPGLFIVSQVEVLPFDGPVMSDHPNPYHIEVLRALGAKCERCWNYSTHVGESADFPTLCERCVAALKEIEAGGGELTGSAKP